MVIIQDEVSDLENNMDFLFGEQIIQDERLLNVEVATDTINAQLVTVDDKIEGRDIFITNIYGKHLKNLDKE